MHRLNSRLLHDLFPCPLGSLPLLQVRIIFASVRVRIFDAGFAIIADLLHVPLPMCASSAVARASEVWTIIELGKAAVPALVSVNSLFQL
jgi:hypothetical protein